MSHLNDCDTVHAEFGPVVASALPPPLKHCNPRQIKLKGRKTRNKDISDRLARKTSPSSPSSAFFAQSEHNLDITGHDAQTDSENDTGEVSAKESANTQAQKVLQRSSRAVEQQVSSTRIQPAIVHSPPELWEEIEKLKGHWQLEEELYIFESLTQPLKFSAVAQGATLCNTLQATLQHII